MVEHIGKADRDKRNIYNWWKTYYEQYHLRSCHTRSRRQNWFVI